jgi:hypothetical protein
MEYESLFVGLTNPDCGGGGSTGRQSWGSRVAVWGQSHLGQKTLALAAGNRERRAQTAWWGAHAEAKSAHRRLAQKRTP